jgi:glyoxylase-like metal-dependent hydrolase (beta-lactamase superfamily II)
MAEANNEYIAECVGALANANVSFVDGEAAITSELTFVATPGHTPGHVAIGIQSAGERALIVGDASHFEAQLEHPDWSPSWDVDPDLAADTRRRLFDRISGDGTVLMAGHWPFPGYGRVIRLADRRVFQAG